MLCYCYWLILVKKATMKPSENRDKRSIWKFLTVITQSPWNVLTRTVLIMLDLSNKPLSLFLLLTVGVLMLPVTWVVQRDRNPAALFFGIKTIFFYPHLMEGGRLLLRTDAFYWPCKECSASPIRLHFSPFPILNNQNTGTGWYWCGAREAFCRSFAHLTLCGIVAEANGCRVANHWSLVPP